MFGKELDKYLPQTSFYVGGSGLDSPSRKHEDTNTSVSSVTNLASKQRESELCTTSEMMFSSRQRTNSFVSLISSRSTFADSSSQTNPIFSFVSEQGDAQSQASMFSASQQSTRKSEPGFQFLNSQIFELNPEIKLGLKRNSSNEKLLSKDELKRMRHREAQRKYKKTLVDSLKELKDNKVVADAKILALQDQLSSKSHLLGEMQNVVTLQNEEIFNLRNMVSDLKIFHKDCSCQACVESRNQENAIMKKT